MGALTSYSDNELLLLLKKGDHTAYAKVYDLYHGPLYIFAYRRLKNREEAKDIIHELFLKIWNDRENLSDDTNLPAYLYTALRNRIINTITHQKVAERYIESFSEYVNMLEATNTTDYLLRHKELQGFIENEIASLQPRMRMVFELSRKSQLSRKEIAEKLSISEETVKSHMHSALRILKVKLGIFFSLLFLLS